VNDAKASEDATAWHHALLGLGHPAMAYAEEMRTYFLGVQSPASEIAFVHVVRAHAASAAGETEKHRASYGLALAAIEAVSNEIETILDVPTLPIGDPTDPLVNQLAGQNPCP
jgi:hypothetical protein